MRARHPLLALLGLLAAACAARDAGVAPGFDGARAFADLETQVGFGPRIPGSPGHQRTRAWLAATLTPLAGEVSEDRFEAAGLPLVNLTARFRPDAEERVWLLAHWDTRPHADLDPDPARRRLPGANDGASGVAVLVELARLFHARPPRVGVDLIFLDGEDYGEFEPELSEVLLGSQRLARVYRGPRPRFGLLLDMVGDRDLLLRREALSAACCARTVDKVWGVAAELGHGAVFVAGPGPEVLDDHVPLNRKGLGVVVLIDLEYEAWHTTLDLPERTSAKSLEVIGQVVAEVVYRER